jgi:3-oxoacyl-[acyl-carrier protein] reductase
VVINYTRSEAEAKQTVKDVEAAGGKALLHQADVGDDGAVVAMVQAAVDRFGRMDALVNCAGMTIPTPPSELDALQLADWDRVFAVNVRGTFSAIRASAPHLRKTRGAIVNLASVVGLRPGPQPIPYSASKAAIINMTRTLAGVLGPEVRVNAVAPGWMEGRWMEKALGAQYADLMQRRARRTPLQRVATPDDVAATIVGLIESNPFVSGETIVIDGGYTATT